MSYQVFARKYRPQKFDEVVCQSHVTSTLSNAIAANRVAHAILFVGPRGTGKTTVARILAKAMNCEDGPTGTPCNKCQECKEITAGNSSDVYEIDGASNNGVDQVRELRENLKYMPTRGRYKIYIIDEVHMLSLAAFNALLKTLEEPPEHVMFMFATTEVHKIPVTILSRCQRHDLRRIDGDAIVKHLEFICGQEKVDIDTPSLMLIAQEAGGSIRDGLSLLDHVLACAQGPVTVQMISDLLGIVDRKHLHDIADAVFKRDVQGVLRQIDAVWRNGYEIQRFYVDLVSYFHDLTLLKLGSGADKVVDLPRQELKQMQTHVKEVPHAYLLQIFDLLFQAEPAVKFSSQPRLGLEMVFLKLFQTAPALPIETLIESLDQLQSRSSRDHGALETGAPVLTNEKSGEPSEALVTQDSREKEKNPAPADVPMDGERLWKLVTAEAEKKKPSLAGFLNKCILRYSDDEKMTLVVAGNAFTFKSVKKNLTRLEGICGQYLGRPVRLELEANFEAAAVKREEKEKSSKLRRQAMAHPLVVEALDLFNGTLIDIKTP